MGSRGPQEAKWTLNTILKVEKTVKNIPLTFLKDYFRPLCISQNYENENVYISQIPSTVEVSCAYYISSTQVNQYLHSPSFTSQVRNFCMAEHFPSFFFTDSVQIWLYYHSKVPSNLMCSCLKICKASIFCLWSIVFLGSATLTASTGGWLILWVLFQKMLICYHSPRTGTQWSWAARSG